MNAAETARAAAVQYGWSGPDEYHYQGRLVQGNGKGVSLVMFITALDDFLGIEIVGRSG